MAYKATDVAEWILWQAANNGINLSPLQLQKLLYYCQAYSLGMAGERLFSERILAWQHGPVVAEVFHRYKRFVSKKITPPKNAIIPDDAIGIVDAVLSKKGILSAGELRNATHAETPYSSTALNDEISSEKIKEYFVGHFWTSDEEDEYEPAFDNSEDEREFFRESLPEWKKQAILDAITK